MRPLPSGQKSMREVLGLVIKTQVEREGKGVSSSDQSAARARVAKKEGRASERRAQTRARISWVAE